LDVMTKISKAVIQLKLDDIGVLTNDALGGGYSPLQIIDEGLTPGMTEVGDLFRKAEIFLPELLLSAKVMNTALDILLPIIGSQNISSKGLVAIGTVAGDIHDIGKNIVGSVLKGNGFDVMDVGIDIEPERFVEVVRDNEPQVLGLSALLTTTLPNIEETIKALKEAGIREKVKVIIGGAPVTQDYADQVGADSYGADAVDAVEKVRALLA